MIRRLGGPAALLTAFAGALLFAGSARGELPDGFLSETLPNGLHVSILPLADSPIVATQLWYHVGSAHEEPDNRGFAHLFEHLMFGATENFGKEAYAEHHHRHGGYENAYTSFDETVYHSTIAPGHHEKVLEMEADRMVHLLLDQQNLDNEKKIVAEELRLRMENDPLTRVMVSALAALLGEHPYAHPPGGTREDVGAATLDHARDFYDRYYRPQNAHLIVAGPVDGPRTLATARRLFGDLPAGGQPVAEVTPLTEVEIPDEIALREDLPPVETAVFVYALPPASHPDHWALNVGLQLLAGGAVDRFEEILVKEKKKAVFASTEWIVMRRGGGLMLSAAFLPYRRKSTAFRLVDRARDEIGRLEWLDDEAVESAKRTLLRREMEKAYSTDRLAHGIGEARWWFGDERAAFETTRRIENVSREEVERVLRRYLFEAKPARIYVKPERVPLYIRLFGWLYPLVS